MGANIIEVFPKNKFEWSVICAIGFLILFSDVCDLFYDHCCALTPFLDSALWLITHVCTHSHSGLSLCMFWFSYEHNRFEYPLIFLLIVTLASFYQYRPDFRDLKGCYGLYRTFPISNLTSKSDPVFHIPPFPK